LAKAGVFVSEALKVRERGLKRGGERQASFQIDVAKGSEWVADRTRIAGPWL
jgi:hypothetical protein